MINIFRENSKIRAKSDGKYLYKMIPIDGHRYEEYLGLSKAIKLGYQIDDRKCFIKMKFNIGEQEFNSEPMAVSTIFDKDDIHKAGLGIISGAIVGAIVGYIAGHFSK